MFPTARSLSLSPGCGASLLLLQFCFVQGQETSYLLCYLGVSEEFIRGNL
jgi:hypothetical protein